MHNKSYLFIGDLIDVPNTLPLNLFEDYYLQKASANQKSVIKKFIKNYIDVLDFNINKYESSYNQNAHGGIEVYSLEESSWNYLVIEHTQQKAKEQLQVILSLSPLDLTILFESIDMRINTGVEMGVSGILQPPQLRILNYFHDNRFTGFSPPERKVITPHSLIELERLNTLVSGFDKEKFPLIDKAIKDYICIKDISESSPFKVLSCFSVLELLLTTYKPRTSSDSSLSNQLQKKINLLNNQFADKIDIQFYFKGSDSNTLGTIMEKLYQYRNDIAHGNIGNFEMDLKILKNQQNNILPFMLNLLKKILITSLEKPQLISDLKDC